MPIIELKLIQAKHDKPTFSKEYQTELRCLRNQIPKDIDVKQTYYVRNSILEGGALGQFVLSLVEHKETLRATIL